MRFLGALIAVIAVERLRRLVDLNLAAVPSKLRERGQQNLKVSDLLDIVGRVFTQESVPPSYEARRRAASMF